MKKGLKVKGKSTQNLSLNATKGFNNSIIGFLYLHRLPDTVFHSIFHLGLLKCHITVFHISNDCDSGRGELGAQTAPHGHAEGDIEAFLVFIQRVINDHNAAGFLHLSLVKAKDAVMVLGPGDVIRVGQHRGGDGACG